MIFLCKLCIFKSHLKLLIRIHWTKFNQTWPGLSFKIPFKIISDSPIPLPHLSVLFVLVLCLLLNVAKVSLDRPFLIAPSVFANVYSLHNLSFNSTLIPNVYVNNEKKLVLPLKITKYIFDITLYWKIFRCVILN